MGRMFLLSAVLAASVLLAGDSNSGSTKPPQAKPEAMSSERFFRNCMAASRCRSFI